MFAWILSGWLHLSIGLLAGVALQKYLPKVWAVLVGVEHTIEDKVRKQG